MAEIEVSRAQNQLAQSEIACRTERQYRDSLDALLRGWGRGEHQLTDRRLLSL